MEKQTILITGSAGFNKKAGVFYYEFKMVCKI